MAQNDFSIANQGFPSFRSDLNDALQSLASNSSGTTEPPTTYAYQWWYDETNDILKIRNSANDAWIDFATFDQATGSWSLASLDVAGDAQISGDLTVDTDTLYVDSSNNRVGIGTSSPASDALLSLGSAQGTSQSIFLNGFGADSESAITNTDGNLIFSNGSATSVAALTERMRIDSSGNVGIGTSSPDAKTDILTDGNFNPGIFNDYTGVGLALKTGVATAGLNTYGTAITFNRVNGNDIKYAAISAKQTGSDPDNMGLAFFTYPSSSSAQPLSEKMVISHGGNVGIKTSSPSATLDVNGSLSKNSGSFKIDHPVKPDTHHLVHSFVEGPQADNLYRGKVALIDGQATVNIDEAGRMTEGTFVALNGNVQCWTTNEDGWTQVRGKVEGNTLTIEAQDPACTDEVSWLVIGERHDQHMIETEWTDENGRVITEPAKENTQ